MAVTLLLTLTPTQQALSPSKPAADLTLTQQALAQPSAARLAEAKRLGRNAWNYLGGGMCNTLAGNGFGCSTGLGGNKFGRAWMRQAAAGRGYW